MFPTGDSSSVGANGFRAKETRTDLEGQTLQLIQPGQASGRCCASNRRFPPQAR